MSAFSAQDHRWMSHALRLAEHGLYTTRPNPRVGCVLVRNGEQVGEGWHVRAGEPHAEVNALRQAGELARGATAYVTLEPCAHFGRTPPCAQALIAAGVSRVVAAMRDPNPQVAGRGLDQLRAAGIATDCGLLQAQAQALNPGFISRMERGRPWIRIKLGASLDGRTALADGRSQWITGAAARADVQHWRARSCAVLTGIGTVLADAPRLTVRTLPVEQSPQLATLCQPLRIVVDPRLETPPDAAVLPALLVCTTPEPARRTPLEAAGAEILSLPGDNGRIDLAALFSTLAQRGINEVLVEAGARLAGALCGAGLADELLLYLAPALMGHHARPLLELPPLAQLADMQRLQWQEIRMVGDDLRLLLRL